MAEVPFFPLAVLDFKLPGLRSSLNISYIITGIFIKMINHYENLALEKDKKENQMSL